ncbi:type II secretion system minor pseudopilin GspK [Acidovorax sp. JHL-9]|uniref:type II secretion system minor pseudopilin GspK n=1 Tax=Acidovorax sp. JHL-9 TaxID=1276756 RepID=UPI000418E240|nr:type II secretion system minor pseudopilin GspK [Acidovorax sp. JHL-9]
MRHGTTSFPNASGPARQRGAALLAAMLTVTLVATFAAAALWQQWRAIEVETAERARLQSAWILVGALDWSRLILREDGITGGADHLAEPWAVPLQEARLSTFLAADRNMTQVDDASTDTTDAFLSGQITDLQGRLNLSNLIDGDKVNAGALRQFSRLFERLGLPLQQLGLLVQGLREAKASQGASSSAPLLPPTLAQLGWLGLPPATLAVLAPHVTLLPVRTPVNLNTADVDVLLAAIDGLDMAGAQKLVQARQARHFRALTDASDQLGASIALNADDHAIASRYFEVRGRLRLGSSVVEERSLVMRQGTTLTTLWRERGAFDSAGATAAPPAAR